MNSSRMDRSPIAEWWRTVDRWFLSAFLLLIVMGLVLSFAASPAVAERIGAPPMHFVERQFMFTFPAFLTLIGVSFMAPIWVRRMAVVLFAVFLVMLFLTLFLGMEVKGSTRWLRIAGMSVQPSEFLKPTFVVVCAWLFSIRETRPEIPGNLLGILVFVAVAGILVLQPDLGQTMLIGLTWGVMFFMAGLSWIWIVALVGIAVGGGFLAYLTFDHVTQRIDRFMTGEGDTFQVDTAIQAIQNGSWLGRGPGEGTVKMVLPDSHTDFVFAVAGEEFGIIVCALIALVFAFIVMRALTFAFSEEDGFKRLAVAGLGANFGFQALINMAVNLHLMPPKGMTLPFISYGGSSLTAVALGMGMMLALSRKHPDAAIMPRQKPMFSKPAMA
jgi:cell division protein FtsW